MLGVVATRLKRDRISHGRDVVFASSLGRAAVMPFVIHVESTVCSPTTFLPTLSQQQGLD